MLLSSGGLLFCLFLFLYPFSLRFAASGRVTVRILTLAPPEGGYRQDFGGIFFFSALQAQLYTKFVGWVGAFYKNFV